MSPQFATLGAMASPIGDRHQPPDRFRLSSSSSQARRQRRFVRCPWVTAAD